MSANGSNELADVATFEALTWRINGGMNGIDDRRARYALESGSWRPDHALSLPSPKPSRSASAPTRPSSARPPEPRRRHLPAQARQPL